MNKSIVCSSSQRHYAFAIPPHTKHNARCVICLAHFLHTLRDNIAEYCVHDAISCDVGEHDCIYVDVSLYKIVSYLTMVGSLYF